MHVKHRFIPGRVWLLLLLACSLCGCTVKKMDAEKLRDVEFTVVKKEEIPEDLKEQIKEARTTPMKLTYGDGGYLYIARGYGEQKTTGYSIAVEAVYETADAICIQSELKGPSKEEEILKKKTYPYVVVKIEYSDKQVVFE